jgi:hypothetical protein
MDHHLFGVTVEARDRTHLAATAPITEQLIRTVSVPALPAEG